MKYFSSLILLVLTVLSASGQDAPATQQPLLRHEMTPEEMLRRDQIGRGFVETDPPRPPVRNIAEFERMQGALVRYPFGIPISLIKEMAEDVTVTTIVANNSQKTQVINQYVANGVDTSHCNYLIAPTDSYWTRDYGPWFESDSANQVGIIDFPYNRPRPNDDEIPKKMAEMLGISWFGMNVIHTGGNYMCDGFGVGSSTDLVYVENPSQTQAQVDQKMNLYLGITNHQVVADPNISSTIDHIDCWSKFLSPDKILIRQTLPSDPEYAALESAAAYWASQTCSFGYNYKVFRVKTPQDQPYTNSVILNNKVLVPIMNSTWDDSAIASYQAAMPGYEIIGFLGNPSTPWMSTDALHCRVIGIADLGMLRITHIPLYGPQPCEQAHEISADVIACSQQAVIADSVRIRYRVNGGAWNTVVMTHLSGNQYRGFIPKQPGGSSVEYYLMAADASGRSETMPLAGPGGPYQFTTVYTNLTATPDTLWFENADDCLKGKITQLHNYLGSTMPLNFIQMEGSWPPWFVDSISSGPVPVPVSAGDSVAIRVKVHLTSWMSPLSWTTDSLKYSTPAGDRYVIIMVASWLLNRIGEPLDEAVIATASPNPFTEGTVISMGNNLAGDCRIRIVDLMGNTVKSLYDGWLPAGDYRFGWDGRSAGGTSMPAGVYLCVITTDGGTRVVKLIKAY